MTGGRAEPPLTVKVFCANWVGAPPFNGRPASFVGRSFWQVHRPPPKLTTSQGNKTNVRSNTAQVKRVVSQATPTERERTSA